MLRLIFNPGLALIGFRTTQASSSASSRNPPPRVTPWLLRDVLAQPSIRGYALSWMVEMAADSERECRELLTDALINSQVHNSYTMDEFKELFPRKYR